MLSLLSAVTMYILVDVVNNTKKKSYEVTINNVQNDANNYLLEKGNNINWMSCEGMYDENCQYKCVTVQNLIDTGYFKGVLLTSKIDDNRNIEVDDYICRKK